MTTSKQTIRDKTWRWLDEVVIGEQFCPFAKLPRLQNSIRLNVSDVKGLKNVLAAVALECDYLDKNDNCETSLLVISHALQCFDEYLEALDYANDLLDHLGYEGKYQLASFHPQYLFEGEASDDISHYTNRAPYPIFHFIREESISRVLDQVEKPELIPERNITHANALGLAFFQRFL